MSGKELVPFPNPENLDIAQIAELQRKALVSGNPHTLDGLRCDAGLFAQDNPHVLKLAEQGDINALQVVALSLMPGAARVVNLTWSEKWLENKGYIPRSLDPLWKSLRAWGKTVGIDVRAGSPQLLATATVEIMQGLGLFNTLNVAEENPSRDAFIDLLSGFRTQVNAAGMAGAIKTDNANAGVLKQNHTFLKPRTPHDTKVQQVTHTHSRGLTTTVEQAIQYLGDFARDKALADVARSRGEPYGVRGFRSYDHLNPETQDLIDAHMRLRMKRERLAHSDCLHAAAITGDLSTLDNHLTEIMDKIETYCPAAAREYNRNLLATPEYVDNMEELGALAAALMARKWKLPVPNHAPKPDAVAVDIMDKQMGRVQRFLEVYAKNGAAMLDRAYVPDWLRRILCDSLLEDYVPHQIFTEDFDGIADDRNEAATALSAWISQKRRSTTAYGVHSKQILMVTAYEIVKRTLEQSQQTNPGKFSAIIRLDEARALRVSAGLSKANIRSMELSHALSPKIARYYTELLKTYNPTLLRRVIGGLGSAAVAVDKRISPNDRYW